MHPPLRSELPRLLEPDAFVWATGIEDTFITDPWPATGRTLDEYELTQHYEQCADDLARIARLGVRAARYGIPWHRVEPAPGRFELGFADDALGGLLARGVVPIVDLVHYGTPAWLTKSFLHPDYPKHVADYAAAIAERFRGRIHWYTPLNEPRITAWYCGMLGWWPPYARGWRGFVAVLLALCRGIRTTDAALRAVDPEIVVAHVDASDVYDTEDSSLRAEAARRQAIVWLALELLTGRVDPAHPLRASLLAAGASDRELDAFHEAPLALDLVGVNLYPMFSRKILARIGGRLRTCTRYAGPDLVERVATLYAERFGCPLWISETASVGSVRRRRAWMEGSIASVGALRARGVPVVGYTWWPLFSLVGWAYRQRAARTLERSLHPMGLWDLRSEGGRLVRVETPLVDRYARFVRAGAHAVGAIARAPAMGA